MVILDQEQQHAGFVSLLVCSTCNGDCTTPLNHHVRGPLHQSHDWTGTIAFYFQTD